MKKIKIVRIIDRLNIGGPSIHVALLTGELDSSKYETILICGRINNNEGDMSYILNKYKINPIFIPELTREISLFNDLKAFIKIYKILIKEKPDIVHTHKSKAGFLGRLASILANIRIRFHTFHGHIFHGYFGKLKTYIFLTIERILGKYTTAIITISPKQFEEIYIKYRIGRRKNHYIIPLGFDFSKFNNIENKKGIIRKKYNIPNNYKIIGIIGRLTSIKNHSLFLKCAKEVLKIEKKVKFLIIGDGELRKKLEKEAKNLKIEENVIFTGWITDPCLIYCDLDIVTLTSINEGTPVTLIEGMYCKKPIVAVNVGGVSDIVDDKKNGFLVTLNDIKEFTNKLVLLLRNPNLAKKMGENGFKKVRFLYSKERLIKDIENLIQSFEINFRRN